MSEIQNEAEFIARVQAVMDADPNKPDIPASAGAPESPDDGREYLEALAREVIAQFGPGQDGFTAFRIRARSVYRQDVSANVNDATVAHIRPDNDAMIEELREIFNAVAQEYLADYHAAQPK